MSATCAWAGRTRPRVMPAQHADGCTATGCEGCLPCRESHCRVCRVSHSPGTCPVCRGATRDDLAEIRDLCASLPDEAMHRALAGQLESEAMMLAAPAADPEAWKHRRESIKAGRISPDYLVEGGGEHHPLWTLSSWAMVYRDALGHQEPDEVTLEGSLAYLEGNLTYLADLPDVPFEDFAEAVRSCARHLVSVIHDDEQVDRGAPCKLCGTNVERTWGKVEALDGYTCPRCQRFLPDGVYQDELKARAQEIEVSAKEGEEQTGVRAGTIRQWAARGLIPHRRVAGRTVYPIDAIWARVEGDGPTDAVV